MKPWHWVILVIVLVVVIGGWMLTKKNPLQPNVAAPTSATPQPMTTSSALPPKKEQITVSIKNGVFDPQTLTVKKGTAVEFKNVDTKSHWPASDVHPTHLIYPQFDPKRPIRPNESWVFTFDKVGNWKYHDHLSPQVTATVIVTE